MTIIEIRKSAGLSQERFGEKYGIPAWFIEKWESGEMKCPGYIIELPERRAVQGMENAVLKCDDDSILIELGACCREMLRVINSGSDNPYPQAKIFPEKYFMKIYFRALRAGIPDELDNRIMLLMNSVHASDWTDSIETPLAKKKQECFMMGLYG